MKSTFEQIQNTCVAGTDACAEVLDCVLGSMENLCDYQFARARQAVEGGAVQAQSLLGSKLPAEAVAVQANAFQPAFEQYVSYIQGLVGLAAKMQCQLAGIAEAQQKAMARKVVSLTEQMSAGTPASAEVMVAGVQSWLEAANQAMESAARVSREVGELVDAGASMAGAAVTKAAKSGATRGARAAA